MTEKEKLKEIIETVLGFHDYYKVVVTEKDIDRLVDKLFSFEHDILTNPPYKYATEFVLKALELLHEGCKCYMFLKLTFLEGKRRYIELFKDTPPAAFMSFPSASSAPKTRSLTVCGRAAAPPLRMRGLFGRKAMRAQQRCGGYRRTK